MASSPIKRQRFQILDDLGEEAVFWLYIEECRTVRDLANRLFEPHGDAERASCKELYDWLHDDPGRWERWQAAKHYKATNMAEGALETAMEAHEGNVRSAKLKADYQRWYAGVLDPRNYGSYTRTAVELEKSTLGVIWLDALRMTDSEFDKLSDATRLVEAEVLAIEDFDD